ncbi:LSU ribosomal protein L9P [Paucidesulfovibrio gracilis DSM 16080]|uniref:Large ribosomal subunit protein bL9 n=1 Tax=Paucidesulfovibrio gracilis DSM 16080 TaxID=1121449 RepID=A0A1T4WKB2_9BACT|nr:50S ribosomal protein L9 [Paucidesulfovibrio gracilis]SKA77773.1 LSU ribosomal protein L9P [Paucidesulfovibrio gracilis DSM 16080]
MKLILRADVDNLGRLGDIVNVKPGYGRNYLLPQGLAMPATEGNQKQFDLELNKLKAQADALRTDAELMAEKIASAPVEIRVRVGEGDKLYGSVTTAMIADALLEQGIDVDKRKILLDDPIRSLGEYTLEVKLHPDVRGELNVAVLRHGAAIVEESVTDEVEQPVEEATQDVVEDSDAGADESAPEEA